MARGKVVLFVLLLVAVGLVSRFVPHPPNLTAMGGVVLVAPQVLGMAGVPVAVGVVAVSDLLAELLFRTGWWQVRGFYAVAPWVYGAWVGVAVLGYFLRGWRGVGGNLKKGVLATVLFFFVSNFGVWLVDGGTFYPFTFKGLVMCYVAALPFVGNFLVGTVFSAICLEVVAVLLLAGMRWREVFRRAVGL